MQIMDGSFAHDLASRRLMVRRFHAGDAAVLASYRSDPEIARYQSWSTPVTLDAAAALVDTYAAADPHAPGWCQYAIELRSTHTLIGDIGVNLHDNLMQADIGFTLATEHQGNGYATEALRVMLDHLFANRGLRRISAECDARNLRSARLLQRLGFHREGHRRAHTWIKGEWTDDVLFGLLADDWQPAS
jgi:RimJ/RimL family protein N-acetyltransferase